MKRRTKFNDGWFFHQGELKKPVEKVNAKTGTCGGASGLTEEEGFVYRLHPYMAAKMHIDNANHLYNVSQKLEEEWNPVQLPHDWTASQKLRMPREGSGDTSDIETGYLPGGTGYYRKKFSVSAQALGKRMIIEFEGVMRESVVWVNGCYIGTHLSGYSGFAYDISEYLFYGKEGINVVLVKADTSIREGWWQEGAGIYRDVWLYRLDPVHVKRNGIFIDTENITERNADIVVRTKLENQGTEDAPVRIRHTVLDHQGEPVKGADLFLTAEGQGEAVQETRLSLQYPRIWDLEDPYLYTLRTEVFREGAVADECLTEFGVRDVRYTESGLMLNGKTVELKGVCVHQDFAGVGAALTGDIIDYRLHKIKEMGANAYRSAHHPATDGLLSACDRMGILVLNENRRFESSEEGLAELAELIEGSRNHPCIFMWSLENEELVSTLPIGKRILKRLTDAAHKLDPTRQCTVAGHYACRDEEYVIIPDVAGFNYDMGDAKAMREAVPGLLTVASEDGSFASARGIYADDRSSGYCDSYDSGSYMMKLMMEKMGLTSLPVGTIGGASSPNNLAYSWNQYKKAPFLGGMFVWSAFDYRGETFPWNWPAVTSQYGAMDCCGFEKDAFYYWKSIWTEKPMVHVLPHWNWAEGQRVQVDAYSNCEEAELFVNGISQGKQKNEPGSILSWTVDYKPGILQVKAYLHGDEAAGDICITAGKPAKIRLKKVYDGKEDCLVKAEITDADGNICPTADNFIAFTVEGGRIKGLGNGNPAGHENGTEGRRAFNGLALAIVGKTDENVRITAAAIGLCNVNMEL